MKLLVALVVRVMITEPRNEQVTTKFLSLIYNTQRLLKEIEDHYPLNQIL